MVALDDAATPLVVTLNVAAVAPAGTTTLAGTVAMALLLLVRVTVRPALGAGPFRVTVPTDAAPPWTVLGFKVRALAAGAETLSVADFVTPPPLAEIDDEVLPATG